MTEMVDLNIALIECLEKKRYPFETMDALYFLTPTETSISLFLSDWEKKPIYASAHLFFTDHVSDELFNRINTSKAKAFIRTFREVYLDFVVYEPRVFLHSYPVEMHDLYVAKGQNSELMTQIARSICSLCISCKVQPTIRYSSTRSPQDALIASLAESVQDNIRKFLDTAKPDNFSAGTLLILDRSYDCYTPFLHEFNYQAIVNDVMEIEGGKKYTYQQSNGEEKVVYLDEDDPVFQSLKHMHLAECSQKLVADFNDFEEANKEPVGTDIGRMQEAVANMQEYHMKKEKFGIHLSLATECNKQFSVARIDALAMLEQDLVTGFDIEGDPVSNLFADVHALMSEPSIDMFRKARLIILYIASNGGIQEAEMKKLLSVSGLPQEFLDCFKNLPRLGISMGKPVEKPKKKKGAAPPQAKYDELNSGTLSKDNFLAVPGTMASMQQAKRAGTSMRAGKPTWQTKKAATAPVMELKGDKIIVYVLGGISHAEIMEIYRMSQQLQRDIVIGSTGVYTQNDFIQQLSKIH